MKIYSIKQNHTNIAYKSAFNTKTVKNLFIKNAGNTSVSTTATKSILIALLGLLPFMTKAQNRLQEAYKNFIRNEFYKADINPVDNYVSVSEFYNYIGDNNVDFQTYDNSMDNKLDISEFSSIIKNNSNNITNNSTSSQSYDIQNKYDLRLEARSIAEETSKYYRKIFYKGDDKRPFNKGMLNAYSRLNKDNILLVTEAMNNKYKRGEKCIGADLLAPLLVKQGNHYVSGYYTNEIIAIIGNAYEQLATKNGINDTRILHYIYSFKDVNSQQSYDEIRQYLNELYDVFKD